MFIVQKEQIVNYATLQINVKEEFKQSVTNVMFTYVLQVLEIVC